MKLRNLFLLLFLMAVLAGFLFVSQYKKSKQITIKKVDTPLISEMLVNIPIESDDQIYGNPGAPITVVEFMDLNCEECVKMDKQIREFIFKNPLEVRLVWKDAPRPTLFFGDKTLPHRAAYCAGKENKFWDFVDLAEQQSDLKDTTLNNVAAQLQLNMERWAKCLDSDGAKQKMETSKSLAQDIGATRVPSIFVNNRKINSKDVNIEELLKGFTVETK